MVKPKIRRKTGARRYADYPKETLDMAVDLVSSKALSSYEAEKQFGIPRRTIVNKCLKRHDKPIGRPFGLALEDEKHIADTVNIAAKFGSPLSLLDLRIVVYNYLEKVGKTALFKGKMPGERWARNFLERHDFTQRATQNIKRNRAAKTAEELMNYYDELASTIKDVPSTNILNFDETNLSDDPGSQKAIFKRGTKHPERVLNSSKSSISIMFSATADGECLPPYVVYKAEHLWSRWCEFGPPKARYNRTKSGWFDMVCFEDWFKTIVLPWANSHEGVKVIIGDNLASHLSVETARLCEENNIRFTFLPKNATHLTQPLDVAFFGPMKKRWREILLNYKLTHQDSTTLNKIHFQQLLHELMTKINMTQEINIRNGFAGSGIYPFDPSRVLQKLPSTSDEEKKQFDTCLLEYLQRVRKSTIKTKKGSNKRLTIQAGKSVSTEEANKMLNCNEKLKTKIKKDKKNVIYANIDQNTEYNKILLQPLSLKQLCIQFMNDSFTQLQENNAIDEHTRKISDIVDTVSMLHQVSDTSQNLPFLATHKRYLPDCLQSKENKNNSNQNSSKIVVISDVVIKACEPHFHSPRGKITKDMLSPETSTKAVLQTMILPKTQRNTARKAIKKDRKKGKGKKDGRKVLQKRNKKHYNDESSSSDMSSSEVITAETDDSDCEPMDVYIAECLEEQDKENFDVAPQHIPINLKDIKYDSENNTFEEGKWVLARFATKKTEKHFVGRILSVNNAVPTIKFVRRVKTFKCGKGTFSYPIVDDIFTMTHSEDIISVLPSPEISRRGQIIFNVDFSGFNIQ